MNNLNKGKICTTRKDTLLNNDWQIYEKNVYLKLFMNKIEKIAVTVI